MNHSKARKISGLVFLFVFLMVMTPYDRAFAAGTDAHLYKETDRGGGTLSSESETTTKLETESEPEEPENLLSAVTPALDPVLDEDSEQKDDADLSNKGSLDPSETALNIDEYSDVIVSNAVTGKFADMTKAFMFTVYFKDSSNKEYSEGEIVDCGDSVLILTEGGKAEFFLADGQSITLKELPSDANIQIVQTEASGYKVSFKDSENENFIPDNKTELINIGTGSRSFDFVNDRTTIIPVGLSSGSETLGAVALLLVSAILSGVVAVDITRRRTCPL